MTEKKIFKRIGILISAICLLVLIVVFIVNKSTNREPTILPTTVFENSEINSLAPTPTTQPTATPPEATQEHPPLHAELAHANLDQPLLVADKIYETESGYILTGVQQSIDITDDIRIYAGQHVTNFVVVDRNGNEIPFKSTMDFPFEVSTTNYSPWGVKIDQKDIAWPVTVTLEEAEIYLPGDGETFILDVGDNPPEDQVWEFNREIENFGYHAKLISIGRIPGGYEFILEYGTQVNGVVGWFMGDYPIDDRTGDINEEGRIVRGATFEGELPTGELTVFLKIQEVMITGPWVVTFEQP